MDNMEFVEVCRISQLSVFRHICSHITERKHYISKQNENFIKIKVHRTMFESYNRGKLQALRSIAISVREKAIQRVDYIFSPT
jgi:hypothetical protein